MKNASGYEPVQKQTVVEKQEQLSRKSKALLTKEARASKEDITIYDSDANSPGKMYEYECYYYSKILTNIEREILLLIANGHNNNSVAKKLGLSRHTVKFHLCLIMQKLRARNRAHATYLALKYSVI